MKNKIKSILSVFLCLILFLCVPSTVNAQDYSYTTFTFFENPVDYREGASNYYEVVDTDNSFYISDYTWKSFETAPGRGNIVIFPSDNKTLRYYFEVDAGDVLTFNYDLNIPSECPNAYYYFYISDYSDTDSNEIFETDYISFNGSNSGTISYTFENSFDKVSFTFSVFPNSLITNTAVYQFNNLSVNIKSAQTGFFEKATKFFSDLFAKFKAWFDNLFEWLKDIRDNAVDGFASVGAWFSELGNNIKSFFSDLTNNIKSFFTDLKDRLTELFNNVGEWFSEIGDRIGDFFSNLWENITIKVDNITLSIKDWWQSVVDWFHSLFVPEDGFFDTYKQDFENWARLHFALFYDVNDIIDSLFDVFTSYGTADDYFYVPEVKLPFFDNPVIIPQTKFSLTGLIHQNSFIELIYELFQIIVCCIGFFFILKYCMSTFSKILTGDDDTL